MNIYIRFSCIVDKIKGTYCDIILKNNYMKLLIYTAVIIKIFFFQIVIADELFLKGKEIFLNAGNCATCHSLKDAGSNAMVGPNLDEIRPDIGRVKNAVMNGIGVMPAYQGILSGEEIDAVSYYVSESVNN